jgi:ligand-binding SRPBCC domain-containing protein
VRRAAQITVTSAVPAARADVWEHAATLDGVNLELGPLLRMTAPAGARIDEAPVGRRWMRSWLLLGGVLPVEWDDVRFERVDPGAGFLERSSMASVRVWEHERTLREVGDWTLVSDRVRAVPRGPLPAALVGAIAGAVFRRRHRRLGRRFAGASALRGV